MYEKSRDDLKKIDQGVLLKTMVWEGISYAA